jgi:hypothetical protein
MVYPRATRVVCRTPRGLELGEVLAQVEDGIVGADGSDQNAVGIEGEVIRRVTAEDDLLQQRLVLHRDEAFDACQQLLDERNVSAAVVAEAITAELANAYEAKSQIGQFAEALDLGCGPDCGTDDAAGCSSGACATCVVASACHKPS